MTKYLRFLCKFTSGSGETPTGNFSDVFLSYDNVEQKDACKRNLCYIYSFVWFWNIVDHWFKQEKREKGGEFYFRILQLNKCYVSTFKEKNKNLLRLKLKSALKIEQISVVL